MKLAGVGEMEGLAHRLRRLRLERNLSVRNLARRAGVSVSYVYAVESGVRGTHVVKLRRIAAALGVSLQDLCGGDEQ